MANLKKSTALMAILLLTSAIAPGHSATAREWTDGGEDEQLAVSIRAEMARHSVPWANMARFQVLDHVVYLHGEVDTYSEAADEVDIIRAVPGVKRVYDMTVISNS